MDYNLGLPSLGDLLMGMLGPRGVAQTAGSSALQEGTGYKPPATPPKKSEERLPAQRTVPPVAKDLSEGVALGDIFYGAGDEEGAQAPASVKPTSATAPSAGPSRFTTPIAPAGGSWDTSDPRIKLFLLQTALSALTGGVGQTPMGIIGNAIGEGGEAVGRLNKAEQERETMNREMRLKEEQLDISREGSQLKSLRARNASLNAVKDLDPVAQAYFGQRIKALNQEDIFHPEVTPQDRFNQILDETKALDLKTRLASGKLRAVEFSDPQIAAAAQDPAIEQRLLSAVRSSPTETALLQKRIQAARGVTPNAGTQGKK